MRLTKIADKGNALWNGEDYCSGMSDWCENYIDGDCDKCPVAKLLDRLAEYEEIGFEPKEIKKLEKIALYNADKLINKIEQI